MKLRRVLRSTLWGLLAVVLLLALLSAGLWWYFHPAFARTDGIVYGQRHGHNLTYDIVRPAHGNALGILVMVSGGWRSSGPGSFRPFMGAALLRLHGGADTLVPPDQSARFQAQARKAGRTVELIIRPGKQHGWLTMLWDVHLFADWFDRSLQPRTR